MEIVIQGLYKSYLKGKRTINVINDFSYTFTSGGFYLIKGESGKGKTTLLTLIALLQNPDAGQIFFDGLVVTELNSEEKCEIRRDKIGIIFQDFNLLDGLSSLENVILSEVCERKVKLGEAKKRAERILTLLRIQDRANHYPNELSGGEQQRVGVARAIFKSPDILICDEPVSNLDDENAEAIGEFLNNYCRNEAKIVIATSHGTCLDKYADEIISL